jgi:hypothetical protein
LQIHKQYQLQIDRKTKDTTETPIVWSLFPQDVLANNASADLAMSKHAIVFLGAQVQKATSRAFTTVAGFVARYY